MMVDGSNGRSFGVATCYQADFRNQHASVAAVLFPGVRTLGWPLEGFELMIDYLFNTFPFRKLYGETFEPNLRQFSSVLQDVAVEEGRLRQHEDIDGRLEDKVFLAIYREAWEARDRSAFDRSGLLERIRAAESDTP
jgi:RimJ/RimL family protein N-acetyltransferase